MMPASPHTHTADAESSDSCFASARFSAAAAACYLSPAQQQTLQVYAEEHPQRPLIQQFIHHCFARRYAADIHEFMPYLIAWRRHENWVAALGLRPAANTSLFVEHYLDEPVENYLRRLSDRPVARRTIVEVGNLAITESHISRLLFITITAFLAQHGFEWVVFTANPDVRNIFQRLQLKPIVLKAADPLRLGCERMHWGSYYGRQAQVMAGYIPEGYAMLEQNRLSGAVCEQLQPVLQQLHQTYEAAAR
jgi:hypothetical protein